VFCLQVCKLIMEAAESVTPDTPKQEPAVSATFSLQVCELIMEAVQLGCSGADISHAALQTQCSLPGAQQLQPNQAMLLLAAAVRQGKAGEALDVLIALVPAVQQMAPDQLAFVNRCALAVREVANLGKLLSLRPVRGWSSAKLLDEVILLLQQQQQQQQQQGGRASDEAFQVFQQYCELLRDAPDMDQTSFCVVLQVAIETSGHMPTDHSSSSSSGYSSTGSASLQ
jgi:hypothetical protein